MPAGRFLLLAAVVLMNTEAGGCHPDTQTEPDPRPSLSLEAAQAKVSDWLREYPLGPVDDVICRTGAPGASSSARCTVQRQGRTFTVDVGYTAMGTLAVGLATADDPVSFVAQSLDLVGPAPRKVTCPADEEDPCLVQLGPGQPDRQAWIATNGGFLDVQVEVEGSGRTSVIGGGPLIDVRLERGQRLTGPDVVVRGTVAANPSTGTPVKEVCVLEEGAPGSGACVEPGPGGRFAVPALVSPYVRAVQVVSTDIAGAESTAVVPVIG